MDSTTTTGSTAAHAIPERSALARVLTPLDLLAEQSAHVRSRPLVGEGPGGRPFELPRYYFAGPPAEPGSPTFRFAIFAGIHGDEIEGTLALGRFFARLERQPTLATGWVIFGYPVCNPSGLEQASRHSRSGRDLDREFWRDSTEPEVRLLEGELRARAFAGIVSLHSHRETEDCFGLVNGDLLAEHLLAAALAAAAEYLPIRRPQPAERHFISPGMLQAAPDAALRPFELVLVTPRRAPIHHQVEGTAAGLLGLLAWLRRGGQRTAAEAHRSRPCTTRPPSRWAECTATG